MNHRLILLTIICTLNFHSLIAQTSAGNSFYVDYPSWNAGSQPPVYFDCGTNNILNTGNELTLEVWVRLYNSTWNQKILGKVTPAFNNGFLMGAQLGQNYTEIWNPGLNTIQAGSTPIDSAWVHFATSFASGVQMLCYINGEQVGGLPLTSSAIASSTNPFIIGIAPWDLSNFQTFGQIDEVRIWSVAKTQDEIKSSMHKTLLGTEQNLVAYYDFNQSSGGVLPDVSGNANTGNINSAANYWSWSPSYAAVGNSTMYDMVDVNGVWYGKDPSLYNYATTINGLNLVSSIQAKNFDYAVYGHNDSAGVSATWLPINFPNDFIRCSREWNLNKGGNVNSDLYFNISNASGGGDSLPKNLAVQNYTLLHRTTNNQNFTAIAAAGSLLANGTVVKFSGVSLQDGFYSFGVGSSPVITSAPELNGVYEVQVFPNPCTDEFTLSNVAGSSITLYDLQGKKILCWEGTELSQKINVSQIENGIYMLQINRDQHNISKKLIIQK